MRKRHLKFTPAGEEEDEVGHSRVTQNTAGLAEAWHSAWWPFPHCLAGSTWKRQLSQKKEHFAKSLRRQKLACEPPVSRAAGLGASAVNSGNAKNTRVGFNPCTGCLLLEAVCGFNHCSTIDFPYFPDIRLMQVEQEGLLSWWALPFGSVACFMYTPGHLTQQNSTSVWWM